MNASSRWFLTERIILCKINAISGWGIETFYLVTKNSIWGSYNSLSWCRHDSVAHATWHHSSHLPRINNSCYMLFEQPSSGRFHATPCVSSYLWFPSHDLLALTKSTHCHFSPRSEGTNASSSSSSNLNSWCIPHNVLSVTKSPVWRLSSRIPQALSHSSDHPKLWRFLLQKWSFSHEYH